MSNTTRVLVAAGLLTVVGVMSVNAFQSSGLRAGATAPNFEAMATDGKQHSMTSLTKNGPVHLYFIKIGCPVNHRAAPFVKKIDDAYKNKSNVVGVINGSVAEGREWAKRYGTKFPILADPDLKIIRAYKAEFSPWAVSVGKDGKVIRTHAGGSATELRNLNTDVSKGLKASMVSVNFDGAPSGGG